MRHCGDTGARLPAVRIALFYFSFICVSAVHASVMFWLVQIKYAEAHLQPVPTLRRPAHSHAHTLSLQVSLITYNQTKNDNIISNTMALFPQV